MSSRLHHTRQGNPSSMRDPLKITLLLVLLLAACSPADDTTLPTLAQLPTVPNMPQNTPTASPTLAPRATLHQPIPLQTPQHLPSPSQQSHQRQRSAPTQRAPSALLLKSQKISR